MGGEGLGEYEGKRFVNALEEGLEIEGDASDASADDETKDDADTPADLTALVERAKKVLEAHVGEVRASKRLTDSPACLVLPKGGIPAHLERLIPAQHGELPEQKRIFELNPTHPLVRKLAEAHAKDAASAEVAEQIEMLYDQALLTEGSPLPDPARFAARVTALMQRTG